MSNPVTDFYVGLSPEYRDNMGWDWAGDGRRYKMNQFLIREIDGRYDFKHFHTELRALRRIEVMAAVREAGFEEVSWHVPEQRGYYQPIVTARRH